MSHKYYTKMYSKWKKEWVKVLPVAHEESCLTMTNYQAIAQRPIMLITNREVCVKISW